MEKPNVWVWMVTEMAYDNTLTVVTALTQNPDPKIAEASKVVLEEVKRLEADHQTSKPQSIIDAETKEKQTWKQKN